ncbi:MAG: RNA polymerase sigma factor [Acidimicrobiia bacterium]
MFPTTVWDVVRAAGDREPGALDQVAEDYRAPVLAFIRSRGVDGNLAEDLCQDVFVRLIAGDVLAKADAAKGRFRSLLCTVTIRVIQDWSRRRREIPSSNLDLAVAAPGFDRVWVVHLVERALKELKQDSPRSYDVVRRHLAGQKPDRNKLWIARRKLVSLIRREIALTCRSPREIEDEVAALSPYLRPTKKLRQIEEAGE